MKICCNEDTHCNNTSLKRKDGPLPRKSRKKERGEKSSAMVRAWIEDRGEEDYY